MGCDADGRLVAVRARIVGDTGAYASVGAKVLERAAGHACGAYRVPNVDVESRAVYTNNPPCGAMRGFGVPQVTFAHREAARRARGAGWHRWLGDPLAERARDRATGSARGQRLGPGVGLKRTLLAVRDAYRAARYAGIACGVKNTGIGNGMVERGRASLAPSRLTARSRCCHSWTEMGQGIHTALRQIVADELDIPVERIRVEVDTERELDTGETTASRATLLGGQAVMRAARRLRRELEHAAWPEVAGREFDGEFVVDWTTPLGEDVPDPLTHIAYGWATQVVILDDEGRLARVVAAQDVGRAINRQVIEGQIEGGVHMGLGYALTEEFVVEDGRPRSETLKSLNIIPASGMPPVEAIVIEELQPEGPYGAKGAGEAVLVPTAAAVAGALYAFDGIRRRSLPMRDSPAARAAVPRLAHAAEAATAGPVQAAAAGDRR